MTKQEIIRQYIRDYMAEHGLTQDELSAKMGHGIGYINGIMNQHWGAGTRKINNLDKFFHFPPDLLKDAVDPAPARQPWPVTVAKLKAEKPIYARAW